MVKLGARSFKRIVPVGVICGMAYINYAAAYVVGHNQLFRRGHAAPAIVLWIFLGIFEMSVYLYWILLILRGPTKCPSFKPFDLYGTNDPAFLPLPNVFACDKQGYPFWCSKCLTVKPLRLFHLNDMNYCCSRFDHYCLWIGTAVGRDNQMPFIKFVQFFDAFFILILAYVGLTTREAFRHSGATPHYIVLYVISIFWITMTLALLAMQVVYINKNWTTLDEMTVKQAKRYSSWERRMRNTNHKATFCTPKPPRVEDGKRYMNVLHNGRRAVVPYHVTDLAFSQGFQKNLINLVLNGNVNKDLLQHHAVGGQFFKALVIILIPYIDIFVCTPPPKAAEYANFSDNFSPDFLAKIYSQVDEGHYEPPLYGPISNPSDG